MLITCCIVKYLAYAHLCIHNLHSENPLDIRGGILTPNNLICNNGVLPHRRIFRTEQEDLWTTSAKMRSNVVVTSNLNCTHQI